MKIDTFNTIMELHPHPSSDTEVLTSNTQNATVFGGRAFKEVIKKKQNRMGMP